MEENIEYLKSSMSTLLLHTLQEKLLKVDIKMQGYHENMEEINVESQNHDFSSPQDPHHKRFNEILSNYFILKINMIKFDGKDVITWVF